MQDWGFRAPSWGGGLLYPVGNREGAQGMGAASWPCLPPSPKLLS